MIHLYFQSLWQGLVKDLQAHGDKTLPLPRHSEELAPATRKETSEASWMLLQRQITPLSQKKANRQVLGKEIFVPLCKALPASKSVQNQSEEGEVKHPRTSQLQHSRDAQKGDGSSTCPQKQGGGGRRGKTPKVTKQEEARCSPVAAARMRSRSGDEGAQLARGGGGHHTCGDRCNLHPEPLSPPGNSGLTPALSLAFARDAETVWPKPDPGCSSLITHSLIRTVLRCCSLFGAPPYTATRLGM